MPGVLFSILRLLTLFVVGYYILWSILNLLFTILGVRECYRDPKEGNNDTPPVTIAVPAYNEVETITQTLSAVLDQSYPVSVVFIDDGSTDGTFAAVAEEFDLVATDSTETTFEAPDHPLTAHRQENNGKAAALNVALERCETPLFGVVDGDTVLEPGSLSALAAPFARPSVAAAGGALRMASVSAIATRGRPLSLPKAWFLRFQALDHLREIMFRQLGRSHIGTMGIVFGAFSLYRTDLVREAGSFSRAETEDIELAIRMQRHCETIGRECCFVHVPTAIAWTTLPADVAGLNDQRQRWIRGSVAALTKYRTAIGQRALGSGATLGLLIFLFGDIVWPLVEMMGYVVVPLAVATGAVPVWGLGVFAAGLLISGPIASFVTIVGTRTISGGYDDADRVGLAVTAVFERVVWRPPQVLLGGFSVLDYFRR